MCILMTRVHLQEYFLQINFDTLLTRNLPNFQGFFSSTCYNTGVGSDCKLSFEDERMFLTCLYLIAIASQCRENQFQHTY